MIMIKNDYRLFVLVMVYNNGLQMHKVLHRLPGVWHLIKSGEVRDFLSNPLDTSMMSQAAFLQQLDNVDEAACSWLALVSGININVFHGFETENDLVNYFLDDAYANNVTVIASKHCFLVLFSRQ